MTWKHDELAHDLANLRRSQGEVVEESVGLGGGFVDVFAMRPAWGNPMPTVYEVKVSREDFLRDVRAGKFEGYLPYCRRLYFAAPRGLLTRADIPEGMGLTVRSDSGWRTVMAPKLRPVAPECWTEVLQRLVMRQRFRAPDSKEERVAHALAVRSLSNARLKLSQKVQDELHAAQVAQSDLANAEYRVAKAMGLSEDERGPLLDMIEALLRGHGPARGTLDAAAARMEIAARQIQRAAAEVREMGAPT